MINTRNSKRINMKMLKKKKKDFRSFHHGSAEMNVTRKHEVVGSIPGLTQWVRDLVLL